MSVIRSFVVLLILTIAIVVGVTLMQSSQTATQQVARQTQQLLSAAGADVTYREIDDLSHCYPREINPAILSWMNGT